MFLWRNKKNAKVSLMSTHNISLCGEIRKMQNYNEYSQYMYLWRNKKNAEISLMSTYNICLCGEIRKKII